MVMVWTLMLRSYLSGSLQLYSDWSSSYCEWNIHIFKYTCISKKEIEFHTWRIWKLKEFTVKPLVSENKNDPSETISPHCAPVLIRFCHAFTRQMLQIRLYLLFTISFFLVVLLWLMHSRLWNFLSYFIFIGILDLRKK